MHVSIVVFAVVLYVVFCFAFGCGIVRLRLIKALLVILLATLLLDFIDVVLVLHAGHMDVSLEVVAGGMFMRFFAWIVLFFVPVFLIFIVARRRGGFRLTKKATTHAPTVTTHAPTNTGTFDANPK